MNQFLAFVCIFATLPALAAPPAWKPVANAIPMQAVAFGNDGTVFAISPGGTLMSRAPRSTAWTSELPRAVQVKFVGVNKDSSVIALDRNAPKIYAKAGGAWSTHDGFAEQMMRAMNGSAFARFADGKVSNSAQGAFTGKFQHISLATQVEALLLTGLDNKAYYYQVGSAGQPTEIVGKGAGKMLVGRGTGTRGSMFLLGAGSNALVYYFEVSPTNSWVPVTGGPGIKFIAMNSAGTLFGIDTNNKLYWLDASF